MWNIEARELYEEWMAEEDEEAAEMVYRDYLRALRMPDEIDDDDVEDEIDEELDRFLLRPTRL